MMKPTGPTQPNPTHPAPRHATPHTVWQSHSHAIAIKADPSYPSFVQAREALASAPVFEAHVPFSGNPRRALEVPVTEMSFYKTDDRAVNPEAQPAAETHELLRYLNGRMQSMQVRGFIALSWGIAFEDATRGFYLAGWTSVEVCLFCFVFPFLSCKRLNSLFSIFFF